MQSIDNSRVFSKNSRDPDPGGDYVVYWMQAIHRIQFNHGLEYAVEQANRMGKPLLIYEELKSDYRWACDRFHAFYLEGMLEHQKYAEQNGLNFLPFVETEAGMSDRAWAAVMEHACLLVTDEYPVFFLRNRNKRLGERLGIPVVTVDSNGLIPLGLTEKDPYSAYFFRKKVQENFVECLTNPPQEEPLERLRNRSRIDLASIRERLPIEGSVPDDIPGFICDLSIDHEVGKLDIEGTRQAALRQLDRFLDEGLPEYGEKRNDPDERKGSGLSPWLHFGKISTHETVEAVLERQPGGWDLDDITYNDGSKGGFYNGDPDIAEFLDQLITWREVGFHFAHHRPDYAKFSSLPDWARQTLQEHSADPRDWDYSFEELEQASTHDQIWNAAQRQLRREGVIHNYLRMLWGKKVMEWTPDPETALEYLIELNNKYAIDGRDPNSYSGIFWCFGRFDRAWQERPIFGKVRYMTSESTRRKLKLQQYLERFGSDD